MISISVKLTAEQKEILWPLFIQVAEYNKSNSKNLGCSIFAQVYKDGLIAMFADNDISVRIQEAIGKVTGETKTIPASSLEERLSHGQ